MAVAAMARDRRGLERPVQARDRSLVPSVIELGRAMFDARPAADPLEAADSQPRTRAWPVLGPVADRQAMVGEAVETVGQSRDAAQGPRGRFRGALGPRHFPFGRGGAPSDRSSGSDTRSRRTSTSRDPRPRQGSNASMTVVVAEQGREREPVGIAASCGSAGAGGMSSLETTSFNARVQSSLRHAPGASRH